MAKKEQLTWAQKLQIFGSVFKAGASGAAREYAGVPQETGLGGLFRENVGRVIVRGLGMYVEALIQSFNSDEKSRERVLSNASEMGAEAVKSARQNIDTFLENVEENLKLRNPDPRSTAEKIRVLLPDRGEDGVLVRQAKNLGAFALSGLVRVAEHAAATLLTWLKRKPEEFDSLKERISTVIENGLSVMTGAERAAAEPVPAPTSA